MVVSDLLDLEIDFFDADYGNRYDTITFGILGVNIDYALFINSEYHRISHLTGRYSSYCCGNHKSNLEDML